MILVIVGTADFQRLVKKMDEIAGEIDEEVVMQIGRTNYRPINAHYFTFIDSLDNYMYEARLIVGHGGAGTIISALMHNKKLIAVPRLKDLKEHFDDHQLELVRELDNKHLIVGVFDLENLKEIINQSKDNTNIFVPSDSLKKYLTRYIQNLSCN